MINEDLVHPDTGEIIGQIHFNHWNIYTSRIFPIVNDLIRKGATDIILTKESKNTKFEIEFKGENYGSVKKSKRN